MHTRLKWFYSIFSSFPGCSPGNSFHWAGPWVLWWHKPLLSLVKERIGMEWSISCFRFISYPSVGSRRWWNGIWFFYNWSRAFIKFICNNTPGLPFILAGVKACSLKSLSLIHSEVTEHGMSFGMPRVLVPIMIPLNHYMVIRLQHFPKFINYNLYSTINQL